MPVSRTARFIGAVSADAAAACVDRLVFLDVDGAAGVLRVARAEEDGPGFFAVDDVAGLGGVAQRRSLRCRCDLLDCLFACLAGGQSGVVDRFLGDVGPG